MINLIVNLIRESWFSLFLSFFKRYLLLPVNSDMCRLCFQGPDEEIFGKFLKDINTGFSVHQYCMVRNDSFTNLKFFCMQFSPFSLLISLTPKSDQNLSSPYIIIPESLFKVMRIKEMITN